MENKKLILELIEELCSMSLEELEALEPELAKHRESLGEKANAVCAKATELVIKEKKKLLLKSLVSEA